MLSGNKGEWSEIYTLFKLLGDGKVYAADANLNKISNLYYPILKIVRDEIQGKHIYTRNSKIIITNSEGTLICDCEISAFQEKSHDLLELIKHGDGAFKIPEIQSFLDDIRIGTMKAKASNKRDITLVVHDPVTMNEPELGFSIKSDLGKKSTLFNATKGSNFIYEITDIDLNESQISEINSINSYKKIMARVNRILELGGRLKFYGIGSKILKQNLQVVDSLLPDILAEMLLIYFQGIENSLDKVVQLIADKNSVGYDIENEHPFYEYKIKQFLNDSALGLTASTVWEGIYDATGGYLIVKEDGEILCYHVYNFNEFQDYLLKNTKFDTPSSSRHGFGSIYFDDNKQLFNLNLQIRFT